ncbi:MAG: NAD(P)/FAD-dependent oxidoreductase [Candidatus Aminicenantes bacterium]
MNRVVIFGAGPAGLTAGYESLEAGLPATVIEQDRQVGGIARTVEHHGCLFDVGGHRFFTKHARIQARWEEWLGPAFRQRPRLSRIYYGGRFFDYPLKPLNALTNLGPLESARVMLSYLAAKIRPARRAVSFEDWITDRFGKRLFQMFFKTYTEKVWGINCRELRADWAAQRIKTLTLGKAALDSFGLMKNDKVPSLIESFHYPDRGPGQMWERVADLIRARGGRVDLASRVVRVKHIPGRVTGAVVEDVRGRSEVAGEHFISTLPLKDLVLSLDPAPPDAVISAASGLRYRDFFTVGLVLAKPDVFPDNWIYIHSPDVLVGRMQNFKNWSPQMVSSAARSSLGLEYFCFDRDPIWREHDEILIGRAASEVRILGLGDPGAALDGIVIRAPKAYPIYDEGYKDRVAVIRDHLSSYSNLQTVGRNGLHRYNNQDHSMLTAIAAVRNILGDDGTAWDINMDDSYHESG